MAGHVLGLSGKPHTELDLEAALERAFAFVQARGRSDTWLSNCRHSLAWFRRFLEEERGDWSSRRRRPPSATPSASSTACPPGCSSSWRAYLTVRRANWRPSRRAQATYQFWHKQTRLWHWLVAEHGFDDDLGSLTREQIYGYIDRRLQEDYAIGSINQDLYNFQGFLRFLERRGRRIPLAVLTMSGLKPVDSLPQFLTDAAVNRAARPPPRAAGRGHHRPTPARPAARPGLFPPALAGWSATL